MSEPGKNKGRGLVDCELVETPSNFIAGRPKAALLFCLLLYVSPLARFIAIVTISLGCDSSIVATCPSIPAARFAFVVFVLFVLFVVVLSGEPNRNKGEDWSTADLFKPRPAPRPPQ